MARLVIVAGPAFRPTSPIHFPPIFIPNHQSFPPLRPGLSLWQVPPHPHLPTSSSPSLPPLSLPGFHLLMHRTRLATVASLTLPPASPLIPPSSSYLLPPIPIIPARLVIVAGLFHILFIPFFGPAVPPSPLSLLTLHLPLPLPSAPSGSSPSEARSRLPLLLPLPASSPPFSPLLPYSLSPLAAPRAPVAMVDPKRSCCRSSSYDPQVILLAFQHFEKYQLLRIVWLCLTFRYHATMMDYVAWLCFASTSLVVVMVRYYVLAECFQLYKTI